MPDLIDRAQDSDAQHLARALHLQSVAATNASRPTPAGHCLNPDCQKDFPPGSLRLFCGPVCAERFEATA